MAAKSSKVIPARAGFDIVCVVGRVEIGVGTDTPEVAAFKIIGAHGADGTFTFPRADGGTCHVTVESSEPESLTVDPEDRWV